MTQEQSYQLRDRSQSLSVSESVANNDVDEQSDACVLWQSETARQASNSKKTFVLLGCAMLVSPLIAMVGQLPIWGFAMTYGIVQEYYHTHWTFTGSPNAVGIIGTTSNGVMYLSMPILFALFSRHWAHHRRLCAISGAILMAIGFLLASFSTHVWHLVVTQGIVVALGCVMIYSPTTLSLSEYFSANNRAIAYGVVLSAKNITGSACPFLMQFLLERYGYRNTMRIWMVIAASVSLVAVSIMPMDRPGSTNTTSTSRSSPSAATSTPLRTRRIPWSFLSHPTIYIYTTAIIFQSSGYGIAQTYLNSYAQSIASLSATSSTLLLTLFNAPGIISSSFFGFLADNKRMGLSADVMCFISAVVAAGAVLGLWGFAPGRGGMDGGGGASGSGGNGHGIVLLVSFSIIYGAFAGGYSATWGRVLKEMERDARRRNEALDTGLVYGLLNGARGVGFVGGGLVSVRLLKMGVDGGGRFAYETVYGPLILFTGLSTLVGGWSLGLRGGRLL